MPEPISATLAASIGIGALAGGASLFGLFGKKKNKIGFGPTISPDIPGFRDLRSRVESAQAGFGQGFAQRVSSPAIAQREAGFALREKPALEESFGARGLGRSSLAAREVGSAFAQKERDVNQLLSQAELQNLQQSKIDEAARINNLFNIGTAEARQQALAAQNQQAGRAFESGQLDKRNIAAQQQFLLPVSTALASGVSAFEAGQSNIGNFSTTDLLAEQRRRETALAAKPGTIRGAK